MSEEEWQELMMVTKALEATNERYARWKIAGPHKDWLKSQIDELSRRRAALINKLCEDVSSDEPPT